MSTKKNISRDVQIYTMAHFWENCQSITTQSYLWLGNRSKINAKDIFLFLWNFLHGCSKAIPGSQSNQKSCSPNVHSCFLSLKIEPESYWNCYKKIRLPNLAKGPVGFEPAFFWYLCSTLIHSPTFSVWETVQHKFIKMTLMLDSLKRFW